VHSVLNDHVMFQCSKLWCFDIVDCDRNNIWPVKK